MDSFTVPQFIDVEDKVFAGITVRQFIILLIAALLTFLFWKLFDTALFVLLVILVDGFAVLLAFVKIRGQVFHIFLLNVIQTMKRPALTMWRKEYSTQELQEWVRYQPKNIEIKPVVKPTISRSRLAELSLLVNTGGSYRPEEE
jgi:hypothetical protein